ncbi:MAG: 2Fe-2S iron-sulfur cluster-binding protein [Spirochaetia bacterium]|nr:2Fe-2S iron-sulfur cluster-binding protein [Spirochaetia bacterium]
MHNDSTIPMVLRVRNGASISEFRIAAKPEHTVLDVLETLRGRGDEVPSYRHSCHHGSCGTCGAVINELASLMCLTSVADLAKPRPRMLGAPPVEPERSEDGALIVSLEPLSGMTVVSGIAVLPGESLSGIPGDWSYLAGVDDDERSALPPDPADARVDARESDSGEPSWRPKGRVRFEACIECSMCVSVCPVVIPYIGPAALAAINRERQKRPERASLMLSVAGEPDGVEPCFRHLACSRVCPQAVYPGKHIQVLRNVIAASHAHGETERGRDG